MQTNFKLIILVLLFFTSSIQAEEDEIIVLDQGNIVDRGKHEDLVNKDGIYKTIFELQNPKMQVKH